MHMRPCLQRRHLKGSVSTDRPGNLMRAHLIEELRGEGNAKLGGRCGQAALAEAAARVERLDGRAPLG